MFAISLSACDKSHPGPVLLGRKPEGLPGRQDIEVALAGLGRIMKISYGYHYVLRPIRSKHG